MIPMKNSSFVLTLALAKRVLKTVDAGLVSGVGTPIPGNMCVEAAVCYAMGLPHGDNPTCVSPAVRQLKISLNDQPWASAASRAKGMRRLAIAQLGTKDTLDDKEFARRCVKLAIQKCVPNALRAAAELADPKHKKILLGKALLCETDPTYGAAAEAAEAAWAAARDAAWAAAEAAEAAGNAARGAWAAARDAAEAAARAAAEAAGNAAGNAAWAAAEAAEAAARAAAEAAGNAAGNAAWAAAEAAEAAGNAARGAWAAARDAAEAAARAAAWAAARAARAAADKQRIEFAEGVVQILIDMKAPGCEYLYLTEKE